MTLAQRIRLILDGPADFARGGGGRSSKAKGGKAARKAKGVVQSGKGGACCKTEGGKFAPGNNYGSLNKGSAKAAASRAGAKAGRAAAKAGERVEATKSGSPFGAMLRARSAQAAAKGAQVKASRDREAAVKVQREARNAKAREKRAGRKAGAEKATAPAKTPSTAADRAGAMKGLVAKSKAAVKATRESLSDRPKLKPGGSYGKDIPASASALKAGDKFQVRSARTSVSGTITKVNRTTIEYKSSYFGQPVTGRLKMDELSDGLLQRGNKVHKITGAVRTPSQAKPTSTPADRAAALKGMVARSKAASIAAASSPRAPVGARLAAGRAKQAAEIKKAIASRDPAKVAAQKAESAALAAKVQADRAARKAAAKPRERDKPGEREARWRAAGIQPQSLGTGKGTFKPGGILPTSPAKTPSTKADRAASMKRLAERSRVASGKAGAEKARRRRSAAAPKLPPRTADTMSDAIALSSPSGKMSKRARAAAQERLRQDLFGKEGLKVTGPAQPPENFRLRQQAGELRQLAARGMKPKAYLKKAKELEARAERLEIAAASATTPWKNESMATKTAERVAAKKAEINSRAASLKRLADRSRVASGKAGAENARRKREAASASKPTPAKLPPASPTAATSAVVDSLRGIQSRARGMDPAAIKAEVAGLHGLSTAQVKAVESGYLGVSAGGSKGAMIARIEAKLQRTRDTHDRVGDILAQRGADRVTGLTTTSSAAPSGAKSVAAAVAAAKGQGGGAKAASRAPVDPAAKAARESATRAKAAARAARAAAPPKAPAKADPAVDAAVAKVKALKEHAGTAGADPARIAREMGDLNKLTSSQLKAVERSVLGGNIGRTKAEQIQQIERSVGRSLLTGQQTRTIAGIGGPVTPPPASIERRPIADPVRLRAEVQTMDRAFEKAPGARDNMVTLAALKKTMPHLSQEEFVAVVRKGQDEGKYTLSVAEGRSTFFQGLSRDEVMAAGIREKGNREGEGRVAIYIARRDR